MERWTRTHPAKTLPVVSRQRPFREPNQHLTCTSWTVSRQAIGIGRTRLLLTLRITFRSPFFWVVLTRDTKRRKRARSPTQVIWELELSKSNRCTLPNVPRSRIVPPMELGLDLLLAKAPRSSRVVLQERIWKKGKGFALGLLPFTPIVNS